MHVFVTVSTCSVIVCVVVQLILSTMFVLLETENEENVLVCLRVIIELHKQFRPQYSPDVSQQLCIIIFHQRAYNVCVCVCTCARAHVYTCVYLCASYKRISRYAPLVVMSIPVCQSQQHRRPGFNSLPRSVFLCLFMHRCSFYKSPNVSIISHR